MARWVGTALGKRATSTMDGDGAPVVQSTVDRAGPREVGDVGAGSSPRGRRSPAAGCRAPARRVHAAGRTRRGARVPVEAEWLQLRLDASAGTGRRPARPAGGGSAVTDRTLSAAAYGAVVAEPSAWHPPSSAEAARVSRLGSRISAPAPTAGCSSAADRCPSVVVSSSSSSCADRRGWGGSRSGAALAVRRPRRRATASIRNAATRPPTGCECSACLLLVVVDFCRLVGGAATTDGRTT